MSSKPQPDFQHFYTTIYLPVSQSGRYAKAAPPIISFSPSPGAKSGWNYTVLNEHQKDLFGFLMNEHDWVFYEKTTIVDKKPVKSLQVEHRATYVSAIKLELKALKNGKRP